MAWVRIDDSFPDHPKAVQAGPMACWLYVCSIAYANRYLTDGFIPERQIWRLIDSDDAERLADALLDAELWEQVEGGYQIHDYLDYQPSAERVKTDRAHNAERQAKWRERNAGSNAVTNAAVTPAPSNIPKTSQKTGNKGVGGEMGGVVTPKPTRLKRAHRIPDDFTVTDDLRAWGYGKSLTDADMDRATERFVNYWQGSGKAKSDWPATWRSWMLRDIEEGRMGKAHSNGRASPQKLSAFEQSMANIEKVEAMMNGTYEPEQDHVFETTGRVK